MKILLLTSIGFLSLLIRADDHSNAVKNAKEKCGGTPQIWAGIKYTIMPNLFIFGGLLMVMLFFPGWKAPFSNTCCTFGDYVPRTGGAG